MKQLVFPKDTSERVFLFIFKSVSSLFMYVRFMLVLSMFSIVTVRLVLFGNFGFKKVIGWGLYVYYNLCITLWLLISSIHHFKSIHITHTLISYNIYIYLYIYIYRYICYVIIILRYIINLNKTRWMFHVFM